MSNVYVSPLGNVNDVPSARVTSTWLSLIHIYAVTYHKPAGIQLPTPWTDNHGQSGSIDYLGAFHRQDYYYPAWVKEKQYTLRGTRLKERNYDQSGNGTYWVNDSYEWGYADNFSAIDRLTDDDNYNCLLYTSRCV